MKKYLLGLVLSLALIGGVVYATAPGGSSTTVATGTATAPAVYHDVSLPETTVNLGNKASGDTNLTLDLLVRNFGNVPENVKGTVLSSQGVTITSAEFIVSHTDTSTLTPSSGQEIYRVKYNVNTIAPGSPNTPIEIQVKFDVL